MRKILYVLIFCVFFVLGCKQIITNEVVQYTNSNSTEQERGIISSNEFSISGNSSTGFILSWPASSDSVWMLTTNLKTQFIKGNTYPFTISPGNVFSIILTEISTNGTTKPSTPVTFDIVWVKGDGAPQIKDEGQGQSLVAPYFTSYKISGLTTADYDNGYGIGIIDTNQKKVSVFLPAGAPISSLVPEFTVSSAGIVPTINGENQTSGVTSLDFSSPKVYSFGSEISNYTVTVTTSTVTERVNPAGLGVLPTSSQIAWQKLEHYAFIHWGPNTFFSNATNKDWGNGEWGDGKPSAMQFFKPTGFDPNQWARELKSVGFTGMVLTTKHHDGFCLWPSATTDYSTRNPTYNANWGGPNRNFVKEFVQACKDNGMKVGFYLSPWDRNHTDFGTQGYIDAFKTQLQELMDITVEVYGSLQAAQQNVFEFWFDGAVSANETGYYGGKNVATKKLSDFDGDNNKLQAWWTTLVLSFVEQITTQFPQSLILRYDGPDGHGFRWVGNEHGEAPRQNWALMTKDTSGYGKTSSWGKANRGGHENGNLWFPAEVDVSVGDGWFWNKGAGYMNAQNVYKRWYWSVARNANLILNFSPNESGVIEESCITNTKNAFNAIKQDMSTNLASGATITATSVRQQNTNYFSVNNLVDGDYETYWCSAGDNPGSAGQTTITFNLNKSETINRIFLQEYISLGQRIKSFTVEYSTDGTAYQNVTFNDLADEAVSAYNSDKSENNSTTSTVGYKRVVPTTNFEAKFVRFSFTSRDQSAPVLLSEIGLYFSDNSLKNW